MKEIKLSIDKIKNHKQYGNRCIPSAIEAVLKLLGKINQDEYPLQLELFPVVEEKRKKEGRDTPDGGDFSKEYYGIYFKQEFDPGKRGRDFPLDALFKKIESELDKEKYVIISLKVGIHFHNWIIYGKTENGDFLAVNPSSKEKISDVKNRVREMGGTDIMLYE